MIELYRTQFLMDFPKLFPNDSTRNFVILLQPFSHNHTKLVESNPVSYLLSSFNIKPIYTTKFELISTLQSEKSAAHYLLAEESRRMCNLCNMHILVRVCVSGCHKIINNDETSNLNKLRLCYACALHLIFNVHMYVVVS